MDSITCHACAHKDKAEEHHKEQPGVTTLVKAVPEEGFDELPPRSDFYQRLYKEHEQKHKKD
jgi:hypothetical protein